MEFFKNRINEVVLADAIKKSANGIVDIKII